MGQRIKSYPLMCWTQHLMMGTHKGIRQSPDRYQAQVQSGRSKHVGRGARASRWGKGDGLMLHFQQKKIFESSRQKKMHRDQRQ